MIRKVADLLKEGAEFLKNSSDTPQLDAEILLSEVLKIGRTDLFLRKEDAVESADYEKYRTFLGRRAAHEPVAYIIKRRDFYEDTFFVDRRVLVPRPETEVLVEEAIKTVQNRKNFKVLDICCGSGCVGLSIKRNIDCSLTLSDISDGAIEVAKINAGELFPENKKINIIKSNLFDNIDGKYDLITANPPYLSENDMEEYCKDALEYEPEQALFGGKTGFEITEEIINQAYRYLNKNGILMIELGFEGRVFLKDTKGLMLEKIIKDLRGIDRVAVFTLRR